MFGLRIVIKRRTAEQLMLREEIGFPAVQLIFKLAEASANMKPCDQ